MSYQYMYSATDRIQIVEYYLSYGLVETLRAVALQGKNLSRATLFRWLALYQKSKEEHVGMVLHSVLAPKSKRPHILPKKKVWDTRVLTQLQLLRIEHPGLGKEKCHILLKEYFKEFSKEFSKSNGVKHQFPPILPSVCTLGRMIKQLKKGRCITPRRGVMLRGDTGRLHPVERASKPKKRREGYTPLLPGDLSQLDTVIIQKKGSGSKRFIRTGIDLITRFAHSKAYRTHHAENTTDFTQEYQTQLTHPLLRIQTDNGTEFQGEFTTTIIKDYEITHFHNYPKSPKQNAFIERFNRTVQEEFINHHLDLLFTDLEEFNRRLGRWITWYTTERPHWSLQFRTPQAVLNQYLGKSHMC